MNSLLLTERDNMQYDRTLDGRNSAKSVVLTEKKETNITVRKIIDLKYVYSKSLKQENKLGVGGQVIYYCF